MYRNPAVTDSRTRIHPATRMGHAAFAVADLGRSIDFYTRAIGLTVLEHKDSTATMGAGSTPLLVLQEQPGAVPQPPRTTGLYHAAIRVPTRADLGRVILNLARLQYPIQGGGDHTVSEALYLADPDGNGLEIYRDRPRTEWLWDGDQIHMGTEALDFEGIVASVDDPGGPFTGLPDGTTMGHMHLRVGDIPQAEIFYHRVLGFDVVMNIHSALFVSAGGYHHHLGLNIWQSRNAPRPPENSVGLRYFTVILPDAAALQPIADRLDQARIPYQRQGEAVFVDDPWGNLIHLVVDNRA